MTALRLFLLLSTIAIYLLTALATISEGINWPAVAAADIVALNWRTQFDIDFIIYLLIFAIWISWREGFSLKGHTYGFLSVILGGMFSFPYLLYATFSTRGDMAKLVLGKNAAVGGSSPSMAD